jgi:hypothetical protein
MKRGSNTELSVFDPYVFMDHPYGAAKARVFLLKCTLSARSSPAYDD